MKQSLMLLVLSLMITMTISAQKVVENSYFTLNVPEGWQAENVNINEANMEMVYFFNSGTELRNIGYIIGIENAQDPKMALENQLKSNNIMLNGATFGPIHKYTFMGKNAQTVDIDNPNLFGSHFRGAIYAFNEGGCTVLIIGLYKVGVISNLPQIWRSITWKNHKKNTKKYASLREELEDYCKGMNKLCAASTATISGVRFDNWNVEEGEDCLTITCTIVEADKNNFTEEQLEQLAEEIRPTTIEDVKGFRSKADLLRRCMDESYVFKMIFNDKNGNFLFTIKVTPDDYNQ